MNKKRIVVIFGGCSPEYGVSLESAYGVISHIDLSQFTPVMVGITKNGDWYHFTGEVSRIAADTWFGPDCTPAALSPNRSKHELLVWHDSGLERITIDAVMPVLHGRNGEDGTVQGACELAGIPLAGCGTLASALCMDKYRAHQIAASADISVPNSFLLSADYNPQELYSFADKLGYPLFVKPVRAGSSFGVSKVTKPEALDAAVREAIRYDNHFLMEENILGFEVGCTVMGSTELITGEPDEIELADGFFDFTEKYNLITSKIHVPARISAEKSAEIKDTAKKIFRVLNCSCFARVDLFLTPDGKIVFNEVNTIPGFTPHSRFPNMMKSAGMPFETVITKIIMQVVEQ